MTALMLIHPELDASAPLTSYASRSQWKAWTREQATTALRSIVKQYGINPQEYALHSGRIGGATRLAAAGILPAVIQREGRWRSGAFMEYVRANLEDSGAVSRALSDDAIAGGIQPGQGTQWGDGSNRILMWGNDIEHSRRQSTR